MSSAEDLAPIFATARPRCALTVRSVIPNSLAISLLRRPETTPFKTSRSRGVNVFMALQIFSLSICPLCTCANLADQDKFSRNYAYSDQLKDLAKPTIPIPKRCQSRLTKHRHTFELFIDALPWSG